jgi:biotin transport system substrate-specific component
MQQVKTISSSRLAYSKTSVKVAGVLAFVGLTIVAAKFAVPLPGTPVPLSLQTLAVTLAGAVLGARLGAASQVTYLALGIAGLPVFAAGGGLAYLAGPTGGYLLSFPIAAALTGWLLDSSPKSGVRGVGIIALVFLLANCLILAAGWAQLSLIQGNAQAAFVAGVAPFLVGALIKSVAGAAIVKAIKK